jgi:predicted Rossmann fold nucleotide-binding protein DprA/Smf involved in DNA uptake
MPPVDTRLTEVSGPDPEATITENASSEMPASQHDADQLVDHVGWALVEAEQQVRATAGRRQSDNEASIIEFLARHPGSTAGDLGKGLNLNPGNVSTRLTQLSKAGEIKRASHGYSTRRATQEY